MALLREGYVSTGLMDNKTIYWHLKVFPKNKSWQQVRMLECYRIYININYN